MQISIAPEDPCAPDIMALLTESHTLMQSLFAQEDNHYLSVEELAAPGVTLFAARTDGGLAVGCGALARKEGYGEIKSMFVSPDARGHGIAAHILTKIEETARIQGLPVLRLETGDLLDAAHRLYGRHGFRVRGPFGDYPDSDASIFMEKALT